MAESCTHDCNTCSSSCTSKSKESMFEPQNPNSNVKKVIGIASGKGGVGKSMVTSLLAVAMAKKGFHTAILDADITGPSIPKCFGIHGAVEGGEGFLLPKVTRSGIKLISANFLLSREEDPVIWRGPVIAGAVKQFWTDVLWEDVDYMFIDMPPGTGDVPLTVFQSIPVDGIILVTTPQDLVSMVVAKAVNMAKKMDIPILGIVENMSYAKCPDCGKIIEVFGKSKIEEISQTHQIPLLGKMPIDSELAALCDAGEIEKATVDYLNFAIEEIEKIIQ